MADDNLDDLPRTRKEAVAAGVKHFFTGKACLRGHIAKRNAMSGMCLPCAATQRVSRRAEDPSAAREKEREYHCAHSEIINQQKRLIRASDRQRFRNREKAYRAANPDKTREILKRARIKRGAKNYQHVKEWRKANPEKRSAQTHRRRARKAAAGGSHTGSDLIRIRKAQNDRCAYCSVRLRGRGQLDHIIALAKGGSNEPNNLQWLCAPCNTSKNARDPVEFARSIGKLI